MNEFQFGWTMFNLYFSRWLIGWGSIVDGVVQVLTLGCVFPNLAERAARDYYERCIDMGLTE